MNDRINVKMQFVQGDTSIEEMEIISVASNKHKAVQLCIKANMHIPIAQIKLYDSNLFIDATATFDDAAKIGNAIEDAWKLRKQKPRIIKALSLMITQFEFQKANNELYGGDSPELKDAKELYEELKK